VREYVAVERHTADMSRGRISLFCVLTRPTWLLTVDLALRYCNEVGVQAGTAHVRHLTFQPTASCRQITCQFMAARLLSVSATNMPRDGENTVSVGRPDDITVAAKTIESTIVSKNQDREHPYIVHAKQRYRRFCPSATSYAPPPLPTAAVNR